MRDEWNTRQGKRQADYNIKLAPDGTISTYLSLFEKKSVKLDKAEVDRLFSLNGQRPLQLVVQAEQRRALIRATKGDLWRVQPDLVSAVDKALADYNAHRAPLYPLNKIQSLGYIDESDAIECVKDLHSKDMKVIFKTGEKYPLSSRTLQVERVSWKPNMAGRDEEMLLNGREMAIVLKDHEGHDWNFVQLHREAKVNLRWGETFTPHFDLEVLVNHFQIPEVPDVASASPDAYRNNLNTLRQIEARMNHYARQSA